MGYRAHVCTTYKVRYGEGLFSHCCEELSSFLNDYNYIDWQTGESRPLVEWEDAEKTAIELSREGLKQLVKDIEEDADDLPYIPDKLSKVCDYESLAGIFTGWLETADPDNGFVRIEWF
jgi:hypothetical protein